MARKMNRGESLIETMFALLVGSLSVMLLATMISASSKLIRLGEENADNYTVVLNQMNSPTAPTDAVETSDGTARIRFNRDSNGDGIIDDADSDDIPVKVKSFNDGQKDPVISYDSGDT